MTEERRERALLSMEEQTFNMMWSFLSMGSQESNIEELKYHLDDLRIMMTQKDGGQRTDSKGLLVSENLDRTIMCIVIEAMALYLSGDLDLLEKVKNELPSTN